MRRSQQTRCSTVISLCTALHPTNVYFGNSCGKSKPFRLSPLPNTNVGTSYRISPNGAHIPGLPAWIHTQPMYDFCLALVFQQISP